MRELHASSTQQTIAVAAGGLDVQPGSTASISGGDLIEQDPTTGTVLVRIGAQPFGDLGSAGYRSDGTVAWRIGKAFSANDTQQIYAEYDRAGQIIGGDAQLSSSGFDSPHLPHVWCPVDRSDAKSTTAAAFTTLFEHRGLRGNPGLPIRFSVLCSDATTAGQVRVVNADTGAVLAPLFGSAWIGTIPAGTTTETTVTAPALALPGAAGDPYRLQVQACRTAGSGTVSVAITNSIGGGL